MDKLTREAQEHGEIFEALALFNRTMSVVANEKTPKNINNIHKFFKDYIISHFQFEEKEIFSTLFEIGTVEEKHLTRTLQLEHIYVLDKLDQFDDLISKSGSQPDENQMNELNSLIKEIIEMSLEHARKEDSKLFPLLKKYHFDLK